VLARIATKVNAIREYQEHAGLSKDHLPSMDGS
jgi:hypothetical protein